MFIIIECETGKYGVNCSLICDCTGECDHVTGKCTGDFVNKQNEGKVHSENGWYKTVRRLKL